MDVTEHGRNRDMLRLLIEGVTSYDAIVDAFYYALRRPFYDGRCIAGERYKLGQLPDGSFFLDCELYEYARIKDAIAELKFHLKYDSRVAV